MAQSFAAGFLAGILTTLAGFGLARLWSNRRHAARVRARIRRPTSAQARPPTTAPDELRSSSWSRPAELDGDAGVRIEVGVLSPRLPTGYGHRPAPTQRRAIEPCAAGGLFGVVCIRLAGHAGPHEGRYPDGQQVEWHGVDVGIGSHGPDVDAIVLDDLPERKPPHHTGADIATAAPIPNSPGTGRPCRSPGSTIQTSGLLCGLERGHVGPHQSGYAPAGAWPSPPEPTTWPNIEALT